MNPSQGQYHEGRDGRAYLDGSPRNFGSPSLNEGTPFRPSYPTQNLPHHTSQPTAKQKTERVWSAPDAFSFQKHNLHHGLDLNGSGERLGFGFLLDGSQNESRQRQSTRSPLEQRESPTSITPIPASPVTDHALAPWAVPLRNIEPTCALDSLLLGFLRSKRSEAAQGASEQRLVGPAYPSVSSLLNPTIESHPLSKVFTDILSTFPTIDAIPQQVAVLYVMFLEMRWQIYPTKENYERLPEWMTPRPAQLFTPHPAWIGEPLSPVICCYDTDSADYVPWPRMRDKLVECHLEYPFDVFTLPYTTTLSVNWPYEPSDALIHAVGSDDLAINPVFERHLRNLSNWSLGSAFAKAHPLLADLARIKMDDARPLGGQ